MSSRQRVWVVNNERHLELGRPDEEWHKDLVCRLGWSFEDLLAAGVIKGGRAVQLSPMDGHEWEEQAQALYDRETGR